MPPPFPRVLLVASSPPPYLPANVHRIRQLSWSLREAGWEAEILAPGEEFQNPEWKDPQGHELFPRNIPIHLARASRLDWLKMAGINGMGWRGWIPMARKGSELLSSGRFQLVYISTTQFNFFCLGKWWKKKHRIPYLLDIHDPWYRPNEVIRTTSSRIKAELGNRLAAILEKQAVVPANGLVSVSPHYLSVLQSRYPQADCFRKKNTAVIPFGFNEADFSWSPGSTTKQNQREILYVGVGSELMANSFRFLLETWKAVELKNPGLSQNIKIKLYGTDGRWRPGRAKILQELAEKAGWGGRVEEDPTILPYSRSLELMKQADGLLVLGVEDPAYMPSKLFSYARSGKPLLACIVEGSQVEDYFRATPEIGHLISFRGKEKGSSGEDGVAMFLQEVQARREFPRKDVAQKYSNTALSRRHAEIFTKILEEANR